MMEGWILVISYFLLVLVNGQDGINWTEANNNRKMVSATVPYCPEQPHCTPELVTETLPYIMDCRKYIYCNTDGTEKLSICPFGLHYRASDGNCVDPSVAGCPKCGTTIEATTESTTEATIESTTEATIESTTEATIEFTTETTSQISTGSTIPVCPEQPKCMPEDAYDSIPYIPDCTKYIYCSPDGNEVIIQCDNDTHYSPTENMCMEPELAGCPKCPGTTTTIDPQCMQEHCIIEVPFVSLPYVANCTLYIYCNEDGSEDLRTCKAGEYFSHVERYCTDPATAQCPDCTYW